MTCGLKEGQPHVYSPLKAIRRKCLDCVCGSAKEVELCIIKDCSLYPWRFGHRPTTARKGSFIKSDASVGGTSDEEAGELDAE